MAKTGITEQQVAAVADQLLENGADVSTRAVREMLGTGSQTTVLRHLRTWRKAQRESKTPPPEMPEAVREATLGALHEVWKTANCHAQRTIDEIRAAAGRRGDDLERDLDDALSAAEDLESQLAERTAELAGAGERITALEREIAARDAEVRVLRERLKAAARDADERCVVIIAERLAALIRQQQSEGDGK